MACEEHGHARSNNEVGDRSVLVVGVMLAYYNDKMTTTPAYASTVVEWVTVIG